MESILLDGIKKAIKKKLLHSLVWKLFGGWVGVWALKFFLFLFKDIRLHNDYSKLL